VTFIAAEDLDDIERETGVGVKNGEHRRNVVTRGIKLRADERTRTADLLITSELLACGLRVPPCLPNLANELQLDVAPDERGAKTQLRSMCISKTP